MVGIFDYIERKGFFFFEIKLYELWESNFKFKLVCVIINLEIVCFN